MSALPTLTAREQYEKDGYVILKNVIDADLVGEMSDHVEFIAKRFPDIPPEHYHHLIMRNDPFWVRVVSDHRLVDVARELASFIGDDVALFSSHYFCKMPHTGMPVLWHQDGSYWPLRPMNVLTLWVAVDRSDTGNGCLRVIRGSHAEELADLQEAKEDLNVLGAATHSDADIESMFSTEDFVDLVLEPGDVSVHHPNIVHASDANTSDRRRCGLTIRYIAPQTECTDPDQPVMLMAGKEEPGINNYRSWPKYRPGFDMPFAGCDTWNDRRDIRPDDEAYFERTDYDAMNKEIEDGLNAFIDQLGGR